MIKITSLYFDNWSIKFIFVVNTVYGVNFLTLDNLDFSLF